MSTGQTPAEGMRDYGPEHYTRTQGSLNLWSADCKGLVREKTGYKISMIISLIKCTTIIFKNVFDINHHRPN